MHFSMQVQAKVNKFKCLIKTFTRQIGQSLHKCLKGTSHEGPRGRVQWNWIIPLAKNHKLDPRPLDKGLKQRNAKLWWHLHGIILEGKPTNLDPKKELKGELVVWRTNIKVKGPRQSLSLFFLLFPLFSILSFHFQSCGKRKICHGLRMLLSPLLHFWTICVLKYGQIYRFAQDCCLREYILSLENTWN